MTEELKKQLESLSKEEIEAYLDAEYPGGYGDKGSTGVENNLEAVTIKAKKALKNKSLVTCLIVALIAIIGVGYWYFKIYKKP